MQISFNNSTENVLGTKKLYTGVINYKVIAINPTKAELESFGFKPKEEPVYVVTKQDPVTGESYRSTRLDFIILNSSLEQITKHPIWVEDRIKTYTSGNKDIVNDLGQSKIGTLQGVKEFVEGNDKMNKWFKTDTLREAYVGEVNLLDFISAWANVTVGSTVKLEKFPQLVSSYDLSELKQLFNIVKNNEVAILTGIKDDKYLATYSRVYKRASVVPNTVFTNALKDSYGEFKYNYQNSFEVKEFTGVTPSANPAGESTTTTSSPASVWG